MATTPPDDMDLEGIDLDGDHELDLDQDDRQQSDRPNKKATLKRGDACLACRRRRIRCNGEKPACATCKRLNKDCVYETGKSTSRIAILKARIADLENQLKEARTPPQQQSDNSTGQPAQHQQSHPTPAHNGTTIPPSLTTFGFATPNTDPASGLANEAAPFTMETQPHMPSNMTAAAASSLKTPYYGSTAPRVGEMAHSVADFDFSFLDTSMNSLNSTLMSTHMNILSQGNVTMEPMSQTMGPDGKSCLSIVERRQAMASGHIHEHADSEPSGGIDVDWASVAHGELSILPPVPQGRELIGGWFDPHDVPSAVRDHLLDLFFSTINKGLIAHAVIHLPRFYARLTLPPSKRPHPALLYSIYCVAARMSSQPTIKQLEHQFFEIADKQLRVAVANHDRLLDAVRGMTLLTAYLFAKEKYSLGYHMCGSAVRLAIACGLDRIPSSVWSPPPTFNATIHCTLRTGGYAIPPPEDAIELGERIYAFWALYETDLCTAIAYLWHTGLLIEDIRTPFPRPLFEYEIGLVSTQDDITLNSIFEDSPQPFRPDTSFVVLRMQALTLLARVLKIRQDRPEIADISGVSADRQNEPHVCSYPSSPLPAFVTHPTGFERVKTALDRFCDRLPANHRAPWRWDEGDQLAMPRVQIDRETAVLHFLIGNAYMQLWNVRALDAENAVALLIARRLVNIMYLFQTGPRSEGYDIFIITIWNEVAMVLVREVKRLAYIGDMAGSEIVDADLGVAIAALKKWGNVDIANREDGTDIAAINGKMLEQLRAQSIEEWAEALRGAGSTPSGTEYPSSNSNSASAGSGFVSNATSPPTSSTGRRGSPLSYRGPCPKPRPGGQDQLDYLAAVHKSGGGLGSVGTSPTPVPTRNIAAAANQISHTDGSGGYGSRVAPNGNANSQPEDPVLQELGAAPGAYW